MIEAVGTESLLPGFQGTAAEAANVYRAFGNGRGSFHELELRHGAVAIEVEPLNPHGLDSHRAKRPRVHAAAGQRR